MQISIETTTQSTSLYSASFSSGGAQGSKPGAQGNEVGKGNQPPAAINVLEAASKKAEEDAVVIATLQDAIQKNRSEAEDEETSDDGLATIEDYQNTASRIKAALGEGDQQSAASVSYESATVSTTTIEAEIGGETLSAQFVSFERVSYDNETGLSVRSASASNIEGDFGYGSFSQQSASVSELYAGTGNQVSSLLGLTA